MIGYRICRLERFFKVNKPKDMNYIDWSEELYKMCIEWEEEHQQEFPI